VNYLSGKDRRAPAVPFDQLFLPQHLVAHSLEGGQRVWALFDLNLTRADQRRGARAAPVWTTVYYPAEVSCNQQSVPPNCVRVTYRDGADWGKQAIVPVDANPLGRSCPGLIRVSGQSQLPATRVCAARDGAVTGLVVVSLPACAVRCPPAAYRRLPPNCVRRCG